MRISVLMNTYQRAHLLRLALRSYLRQTEDDFEIVVADDGSTDDTPKVVEEFAALAPFDVHFVTQENRGHRRAACLNRGIERCRYEWILFTDCDSLATAGLIASHRAAARADRLLCGGYVRLDQDETRALDEERILGGDFEALVDPRRQREIRRKHLKARWQILRRRRRRPHNMGLNYSVSRDALLAINGYDEAFEGWGSADGDVRERLRKSGVHPYSLYGTAIVLHMWHPTEQTKVAELVRRNRAHARRAGAPVFCERGLVQGGVGARERS